MDRNWKLSRLGVLFAVLVSHSLCLCLSLNDEGLALLRLRERVVSDPFGALTNWRRSDTENSPCSWFGVECSDGKVVILNLKDLCLEGTLAPELRSLTHIKSIILRNNSFNEIIPEGFGELKELEVLDLGYNNFTGPLPSDLGINDSLTILLLDNNELLLGSLPPEIYRLQILSESQVDEGELSNAATRGQSSNKKSIIWNGVHHEDTVQRRQLQDKAPFLDFDALIPTSPSPSNSIPPASAPISPASAAPSNNTKGNKTTSAPNVSVSPRSVLAPTPSISPSTPSLSAPTLPPPQSPQKSGRSSKKHIAILVGTIGGAIVFIAVIGIYLYRSNKVSTVKPWATGLSGQLQKAFVTGVPKLKRSELEAACEDFSNVIGSSPIGMVYKGTLSSGVEIAVASVAEASAKDWSKNLEVQFRKKIDTLSKVNHKNFVNLIGFCEEEEPFTRMMVFEYAPNGTLFEHLHIQESEHLDWGMRLRIAMGMAYCLEHMHQLNPPIAHNYLNSSAVHLTEDYAAKLSDFSWNERAAAEMEATSKKLSNTPSASPEGNIYSFGVLLFEMITGRLPYLVDNGSLEDWAFDYLGGDQPLGQMADPTLTSFDEEQVEKLGEVIKSCVHHDPEQRPSMREVTARLREITGINPDGAIPKLSPLWWAELEILSTDAV
ncbi:putative Receptor protein kinase [Melia azedarach]|uniref:Receptor protein kinase n=1 Tax=Melia azedarach TaxID=155640 RepID=A0ACC1Y9I0_MELAZ|nr:putative Receptor protein kinase [Melia azedarach]